MSKIFKLFFFIYIIFLSSLVINADENLKIYSRAEWGADESYRYLDSSYWKSILANREKDNLAWEKKWSNYSQTTKDKINLQNKVKSEKISNMNKYLSEKFSNDVKIVDYQKFDGVNKLAWPIGKTNYIKNIVIHHTYSEYKDSFEGIKNIYKYHSLTRQWGDIGYNYIIGYNGEIFEGRAGGDYVIAAHDTWNNRSTVGISIMGNYDKRELTEVQYESLKKLTSYLTKKYGIDLNKKIPYHRECFGNDCKNGLKTNYYFPIVGHKDGKNTACPGKNIYNNIIPKLIKELQPETKGYKNIPYTKNDIEKNEQLKYFNELNNYNWNNIKSKFNTFSENDKKNIFIFINKKIKTEEDWKKIILYKVFIKKMKS